MNYLGKSATSTVSENSYEVNHEYLVMLSDSEASLPVKLRFLAKLGMTKNIKLYSLPTTNYHAQSNGLRRV